MAKRPLILPNTYRLNVDEAAKPVSLLAGDFDEWRLSGLMMVIAWRMGLDISEYVDKGGT